MGKYNLTNTGQITLNKYGCTFKEMTQEQKREYLRMKKAESRQKTENQLRERQQQQIYYYKNLENNRLKSKAYYQKNKEKIREQSRVKNPFGHCLPKQMFGCSANELTDEQKRLLNNKRCNNYYHRVLKYKKGYKIA